MAATDRTSPPTLKESVKQSDFSSITEPTNTSGKENLTTTKHMIFEPQKLEANENVRPEKTIGGRYP
ncbi:hypothetical protein HRR81_002788 [Exophiala dermatitidis]|uniref:Uncharacterized protein n=1 Tax=Exophiala dermatitidis TaxID=5970 RepID=A0AAN6EK59_EXODE|nr:hypothetical protein HRR77_009129 [Exophiala dermatitidis]KAJ4566219.1 hypothetical protein HRR79_005235 [Exophiala dermatitidis]KAJ4578640.1 hypothetical protein HRR81_002788 [Exophiala dermatitidis]KAJ4600721.1 hypothetical protein HRR85_009140 [Exophiala dermatitidis]KAJ4615787.1 hypothetical protein HRR86_007794 [Exophiala dermatitidis]